MAGFRSDRFDLQLKATPSPSLKKQIPIPAPRLALQLNVLGRVIEMAWGHSTGLRHSNPAAFGLQRPYSLRTRADKRSPAASLTGTLYSTAFGEMLPPGKRGSEPSRE